MENIPSFTLFCLFFIVPSITGLSFASNTITPNQSVRDGETLISSSQIFELGFFAPRNSKNRYLGIWYKRSTETVVWVGNRNNPVTDLHGILTFSKYGNLVLLNQTTSIIWSSNVSKTVSNPVAELLDSGNFVVRDNRSTKSYLWQSFDHPSDTFLSGMKLGWNLENGQETYITSWRSSDDPSPGGFSHRLDIHGLPQLTITAGSAKKFRTAPWNGICFGIVPIPLVNNPVFLPIFVQNEKKSYCTYEPVNKSIVTRVTLNPSGMLQLFVKHGWSDGWSILFAAPMDMCDNYGHCGANTICRTTGARVCQCLKGFTAQSQEERDIESWFHTECKRKMVLNCQRQEGFLKIGPVKLPDLLEFQFNESMNLEQCQRECFKNCTCRAYTNLNMRGGGKGCGMWFGDLIDIKEQPAGLVTGQDLYIRVPTSELESLQIPTKKKRLRTILVVSFSTIFGIFIAGLMVFVIWKKAKNKDVESEAEEVQVPLFDLATISTATNNFSQANVVGEGGFGPVYKGKFLNGQEIAVKRLSKNSGQGSEEFRNEVRLIAKLQHRNLVALLGSCIQGEEKMLIYEYMPNKSLDYYLFDHSRSSLLSCKRRYSIVLGIARGLLYLHQDSKLQIVHRDLKASNILLDSNLNPKISDFGLARVFIGDEKEENTKRVIGTYGYMSPEYAFKGIFSVKSDIFSFGVLLLEIVCGKKNRNFSHPDHHHDLLGHAWLLWKEGRALELTDTVLEDTCVRSQVLRCIQVGLLCVQKQPESRPIMSSVVFMLGNEGAPITQPTHPGFFIESSTIDATLRREECFTENEVTMSTVEAR